MRRAEGNEMTRPPALSRTDADWMPHHASHVSQPCAAALLICLLQYVYFANPMQPAPIIILIRPRALRAWLFDIAKRASRPTPPPIQWQPGPPAGRSVCPNFFLECYCTMTRMAGRVARVREEPYYCPTNYYYCTSNYLP